MLTLLRTLTGLAGLGALLIGATWWYQPETAAGLLGASLLDGTGRTAQIGDSGAFFIGVGVLMLWGAVRQRALFVLIGGGLVGLVAPGRILSATLHGGAVTTPEVVVECILFLIAVITWFAISRRGH
ncbi:hypothetical protein N9H10_03500 [Luminiphilus sp.]|nr:hypothetical protein [Luminiphilus sp.]MDA8986117.1 hypothetical protein [Luminiphilus sp.]MDB2644219.1 hypothetical protein [Luminiphilus sp.]